MLVRRKYKKKDPQKTKKKREKKALLKQKKKRETGLKINAALGRVCNAWKAVLLPARNAGNNVPASPGLMYIGFSLV